MSMMTKFARAFDWAVYPLVILLLFGPIVAFRSDAVDPHHLRPEVWIVTVGWIVVVISSLGTALAGRPLFDAGSGSWASRLLVVTIGWLVVTGLFSLNPAVAVGHGFTLATYGLLGLSLLAWSHRRPGRKTFLLGGVAGLVVLQSVLGLTQLAHWPWLAWSQAQAANPWLAGLMQVLGDRTLNGPAAGLLGDTSYLAALLALSLPVMAGWLATWGRPRLQLFGGLGLLIAFSVAIATASRAAFLALVVGLVFGALIVWGPAAIVSRTWWALPKARVIVLASAVLVVLSASLTGAALLGKFSHLSGADTNIQSRTVQWQVALDLWRAHPIQGSGTGTYKLRNERQLVATFPSGAPEAAWKERAFTLRNEPLQLLVEGGVVGLLLALAALVFWFRETRRNPALTAPVRFGLMAGTAAFVVAACFSSPLHNAWTALAFVLVLALGLSRDEEPEEAIAPSLRPAYALASLALCLLVAGAGLSKIVWPLQQATHFEYLANELRERKDYKSAEVVYQLAARHERFKGDALTLQLESLYAQRKYTDMVALTDASATEGLGLKVDYWKARSLLRMGNEHQAAARLELERIAAFYGDRSYQGRVATRLLKGLKGPGQPESAKGS
jgi:O-antigen ligase